MSRMAQWKAIFQLFRSCQRQRRRGPVCGLLGDDGGIPLVCGSENDRRMMTRPLIRRRSLFLNRRRRRNRCGLPIRSADITSGTGMGSVGRPTWRAGGARRSIPTSSPTNPEDLGANLFRELRPVNERGTQILGPARFQAAWGRLRTSGFRFRAQWLRAAWAMVTVSRPVSGIL